MYDIDSVRKILDSICVQAREQWPIANEDILRLDRELRPLLDELDERRADAGCGFDHY